MAKLEKMVAPPFWTRWAVVADGNRLGTVEKRGMGSGWYAHGRDGNMLGPALRTRARAIEVVEAAT